MDFPKSIIACLCGTDEHAIRLASAANPHYSIIDEKPPAQINPTFAANPVRTADEIAADVVNILRRAEKSGEALRAQVDEAVGTAGWSEWLGEKILHALEETLKQGRETWGEVLTDAYDKAVELAKELFHDLVEYVKAHPYEVAAQVLLTLFAFGVLARLMPWVLRLIGFGELGPIVDTFAAWWQSTFGGYVPAGSLFSFLQRLGMIWAKSTGDMIKNDNKNQNFSDGENFFLVEWI
ncbi:hypothetical protein B0T22DRAFT_376438 [Podospora appendiculata]|uniref:Uncharacterized protein n=1 Tax=Podospora appendiculata TaxID=314037 RepID=A0AAE0XD48_9PEZI|nr:hypothetical protein B0T22DRAFT_376438 [Podospora appendiculata]